MYYEFATSQKLVGRQTHCKLLKIFLKRNSFFFLQQNSKLQRTNNVPTNVVHVQRTGDTATFEKKLRRRNGDSRRFGEKHWRLRTTEIKYQMKRRLWGLLRREGHGGLGVCTGNEQKENECGGCADRGSRNYKVTMDTSRMTVKSWREKS